VLNVRVAVRTVTSGVEYGDEKTGSEKELGSAEAHSALDDEGPIITVDPDLDPVSLEKAFRFAAWSSVALVCDLSSLW
jgi:hypothetical protein